MHQFSLIALVQLAAMLGTVAGAAVSIPVSSSSDVILTSFFPDRRKEIFGIITPQEMAEWLSNQEGVVTYVGLKNHTDIVKRAAQSTTVTYCPLHNHDR